MLGGKEVALRQKFRGSVLICFVPFCRNSMFTGRYRLGLSSKDSTALPLPQRDITWQLTPTRYSYVRRYLTNQILFPGSFFLSRRKPRPETASGLNASNLPQDPSRDIQQAEDGCQETKDGGHDIGYRREQRRVGSRAQIQESKNFRYVVAISRLHSYLLYFYLLYDQVHSS